ncbi:CorA family divalent cation transporter [Bdellovibrio reynosensis]|uniref:Magnesium and cobalt transport protein n=1 Tax=Bdellovibrio reynosensis TaxID=2835041 RepID=A0ABY4CD93_9BACT|nr:CorA family divalent cation transporter [Bdellovibrio reynosensis]UOF02808.1 magnesium and cobalt transport protein [Bdellovibrio reynosensis]
MKRFEHKWQDFKWIDIEAPTPADLEMLAGEFNIPRAAISNSLDPEHLPKCEVFDKLIYIILRHHDEQAKISAATMQEISTKLILFVGKNFVITIHRAAIKSISDKKETCSSQNNVEMISFVKGLFLHTIRSFDKPLDDLDSKTDVIEERVFALQRRNILRQGYIVKRKTSSYRKIFKFTSDIIAKLNTEMEVPLKDINHVREPLDKLIFFADSIQEEITGLINLHLSLMAQKTNEASYRTNEVMRVLTVFSIFFLPLNFIAGVYGMNFEFMPELKLQYGYFITLGVMLTVVIAITWWMLRKGWLKKDQF